MPTEDQLLSLGRDGAQILLNSLWQVGKYNSPCRRKYNSPCERKSNSPSAPARDGAGGGCSCCQTAASLLPPSLGETSPQAQGDDKVGKIRQGERYESN